MPRFRLPALVVLCLMATPLRAGEVLVAVAANFTAAANEIGAAFGPTTGHEARFSFGATGQLFTQIARGAPYEVFLAADQARPKRAVADGFAVADSRFTYAVGRLVLWSADPDRVTGPEALEAGDITHLAIANPATAPYGAAAMEVLNALGLAERFAGRIVEGRSIAQTHQFTATGNATLGFVAAAQVPQGEGWLVPQDLYTPIRQDAVLLRRGAENPAARAFLDFLRGPEAAAITARHGYGPGG